jgi:hypothetical protein
MSILFFQKYQFEALSFLMLVNPVRASQERSLESEDMMNDSEASDVSKLVVITC